MKKDNSTFHMSYIVILFILFCRQISTPESLSYGFTILKFKLMSWCGHLTVVYLHKIHDCDARPPKGDVQTSLCPSNTPRGCQESSGPGPAPTEADSSGQRGCMLGTAQPRQYLNTLYIGPCAYPNMADGLPLQ